MATFNPNVPAANDPNYLGYSRPISQPDADKTLGTLFSGLGTLFDSGVKGLNTLVEESIKKEAYSGIDPTTNKAINALEARRAGAGTAPLGYAPGGEAAGGGALPYDVAEAGDTAGELASAREGGKLRKTYYEGSVNEFTKSLRARYPGYREEVDKAVDRAVMGGRANEFMDKLIADINDNATDTRRTRDKMIQEVLKADTYPYQDVLIKKIEAGQITNMSQVLKETGPYSRQKATYQVREAERKDVAGGYTFDKERVLRELDADMPKDVSLRLNSIMSLNGFTPAKMMEIINRSARGLATPLEEENIRKFGEAMKLDMNNLSREWFERHNAGGPRSTIAIAGIDEYNKRVDGHLKPFSDIIANLANKDFGMAHSRANAVSAMNNDTLYQTYKDFDYGKYARMQVALRAISGDHAYAGLYQAILKSGLNKELTPFMDRQLLRLSTDNDITKAQGEPVTFKQMIEETQRAGVTPPAAYDLYANHINRVLDPTLGQEEKRSILLGAFHEKNQGMVDKFKKFVTMPDGNTSSPQMVVYRNFTSPDIAKEVVKADNASPSFKLRERYVNWTQNATEKLFSEELQGLKDYTKDKGYSYTWDTDNKRLGIKVSPELERASRDASIAGETARTAVAHAQRGVERINNSLIPSIKTVAEVSGRNADAFILGVLSRNGRTDLGQVEGVSREIAEAMIQERMQQKKNEEGQKTFKNRWGTQ